MARHPYSEALIIFYQNNNIDCECSVKSSINVARLCPTQIYITFGSRVDYNDGRYRKTMTPSSGEKYIKEKGFQKNRSWILDCSA